MDAIIAKLQELITFYDLKVAEISYTDDLQEVKKVMQAILAEDNRILKDPAPTVAVKELADSNVNFVVRGWVETEDYWDVYFAPTEEVKNRFDAEGISIPFPQYDVHLYEQK